jgi:hypothetical protein
MEPFLKRPMKRSTLLTSLNAISLYYKDYPRDKFFTSPRNLLDIPGRVS